MNVLKYFNLASNHKTRFKLKVLTQYCLLSGCLFTLSSLSSLYAETEQLNTENFAEFDQSVLMGSRKNIDLNLFAYGNPILAGQYDVNIYVNGQWKGRQSLDFKSQAAINRVEHCFTFEELDSLDIDTSLVNIKDDKQCLVLSQWIEQASTQLNNHDYRYSISVPQAFLKRSARGYVSPETWDRGINAGYLSYNLNSKFRENENFIQGQNHSNKRSQDHYLSLNAGLNIGDWQLRHQAIANKSDQASVDYQSLNTYAQKAFPQIKAIATLGQSYTSGELFNSFAFTGLQLKSEDRMLPETQLGYAPVIRGVANTNAMVEVRQNNQMIYQVAVNPGAFVIDDLFPTGFGSDLEVTVREANGQTQSFNVPYNSVAMLLRPKQHRYAVTAGRYRAEYLDDPDYFLQATYQRGINNALTAYTGVILAEHYQAYQFGAAVSTPIGAFSLDATHAETASLAAAEADQSGQSYRISYNTSIDQTNTQFNIAAYRFSSQDYRSFAMAQSQQDRQKNKLIDSGFSGEKHKLQISIQQPLAPRWGSFFANGSWDRYWGQQGSGTDFQMGYQNQYKNLSYSLSLQRIEDGLGQRDNHFFAMLSFPLQFRKNNLTLTQMLSDTGNTMAINGSFGEHRALSVNAALNDIGYSHTALNSSVQYRSPYATASVSGSFADDYQQYGLNLTGTLLAHRHGVSFSPEMGDTMVLISAKGAHGARIKNTSGLKVDARGYAVIPYVTAYRLNEIAIDPKNVNLKVEMLSTVQELAPFAGAIAKVEFKTKTGWPLLIKAKQANGEGLPFAAQVYDAQGQDVGVVTQGSQILIRTESLSGQLSVKWGDEQHAQCHVDYQLDNNQKTGHGYHVIEGICQ
ncbi:outer membrane usher protein [Acinetobacter calcoaceticus]|uniref:Outer membrane usher protein n=1 Tax=Acinetobacter calcoaceticus TaxID=471 RepID=A0A4R1XTM7_ACICA|nr:outer membrane usher protein [Acinetobacter calcoaceticus]